MENHDLISELPDDIVLRILCSLPLKVAARTCILSKRWISLWHYVSILDFYTCPSLPATQYVSWVNNVCNLNKAYALEEFRIDHVYLDECDNWRYNVIKWLDFAFSKRVKRLVISLSDMMWSRHHIMSKDTFDCIVLSQGTPRLTSLRLEYINVPTEVLEGFISGCPLLEELFVRELNLEKFKVSGPTPLRLKKLTVIDIGFLRELDIDAPNLVSLTVTHFGNEIILRMQNVPGPAKLSCRPATFRSFSFFAHLQSLCLTIFQGDWYFSTTSQLSSLENLIITTYLKSEGCLLGIISIINAYSSLKKLVLSLKKIVCEDDDYKCSDEMKKLNGSLKEVEIEGFVGDKFDREFTKYIITVALVLDRITIHIHSPRYVTEAAAESVRRRGAKIIGKIKDGMAPPSIEFVLL